VHGPRHHPQSALAPLRTTGAGCLRRRGGDAGAGAVASAAVRFAPVGDVAAAAGAVVAAATTADAFFLRSSANSLGSTRVAAF